MKNNSQTIQDRFAKVALFSNHLKTIKGGCCGNNGNDPPPQVARDSQDPPPNTGG